LWYSSPPAAPSPEDDERDTDWQPGGSSRDSSNRRNARKPKAKPRLRRGTRNHRHHRKRRHRRGTGHASTDALSNDEPEESTNDPVSSTPEPQPVTESKTAEQQQVLKEDNLNHKHHHERRKVNILFYWYNIPTAHRQYLNNYLIS
jgi:hypothetical protein